MKFHLPDSEYYESTMGDVESCLLAHHAPNLKYIIHAFPQAKGDFLYGLRQIFSSSHETIQQNKSTNDKMASQTTDIITIVLSFVNIGLAIAAVIIAYESLKALAGNLTTTASVLPLHRIPRRPYHPYTTGYIHYLRDPHLRPLIQAAYRPQHRPLELEDSSAMGGGHMEMELRQDGNQTHNTPDQGVDET
ncbi:hypothetical protein IFR05_002949 [Cadophora sp. M221]|nr:hypothetical protein IFR05_002949 [Cadophora sp. M221]